MAYFSYCCFFFLDWTALAWFLCYCSSWMKLFLIPVEFFLTTFHGKLGCSSGILGLLPSSTTLVFQIFHSALMSCFVFPSKLFCTYNDATRKSSFPNRDVFWGSISPTCWLGGWRQVLLWLFVQVRCCNSGNAGGLCCPVGKGRGHLTRLRVAFHILEMGLCS